MTRWQAVHVHVNHREWKITILHRDGSNERHPTRTAVETYGGNPKHERVKQVHAAKDREIQRQK